METFFLKDVLYYALLEAKGAILPPELQVQSMLIEVSKLANVHKYLKPIIVLNGSFYLLMFCILQCIIKSI